MDQKQLIKTLEKFLLTNLKIFHKKLPLSFKKSNILLLKNIFIINTYQRFRSQEPTQNISNLHKESISIR